MKCQICQLSEINENSSNCPRCNSDLDLLKNINQVSIKFKNNKIVLILLIIALIILILNSYFILNKNNKNDSGNNNILLEQLKQENKTLKNTITELNKKIESDTINISNNQNPGNNIANDEYIVQENDNLWIIAQKFYGDGFKFKNIANENNIKKPYEILVGTKLIIKKN